MCRAHHAVHMARAIHEESMKMNRCRLIAKIVVQVDDQSVANDSFDPWNRPLSVDANDGPLKESIRVCPHPSGGEIVDTSGSFSERAEGEGITEEVVGK